MEVKRLGRSEPPLSSAHIEQLDTMEDFQREEEHFKDKQSFESLVRFASDLNVCCFLSAFWGI